LTKKRTNSIGFSKKIYNRKKVGDGRYIW